VRRLAVGGALGLVTLAVGGLAAAALLRVWLFGDNLHVVVPGVYRSAQLDPARLDAVAQQLGLRALLNLRGGHDGNGWFRAEQQVAAARGLEAYTLRLSARRLPSQPDLVRLVEILQTAERPLLIHCLRGTDRSGLAAALAVLLDGGDPERARREYDLVHGYVGALSVSDLPQVIDSYEAWLAAAGLEHEPAQLLRFARRGYTPYFYRASIEVDELPAAPSLHGDQPLAFRVTNTSPQAWQLTPAGGLGVHLGLRLAALDGEPPFSLELRGDTPRRRVAPGESIRLGARLPPLPRPGRYRLHVDLVDEQVTWFSEMGSPPLDLELEVAAAAGTGVADSAVAHR
jgi:protein tyrosine phosphatase (PTP) superfamily phosphohydrolase (DUF442 family)